MAADVLVDTSVWIDFFRNAKHPNSRALAALLDDDRACIAGPVITELVRGCRHPKELHNLRDWLDPVPRVVTDDRIWDEAGELGFVLARKGVNVFSIDVIIACTALRHGLSVFSNDHHFELFARHTDLRLYRMS